MPESMDSQNVGKHQDVWRLHKARKRHAIDPTDHMVTVLLESFMKLMLFIGNGNVEIL